MKSIWKQSAVLLLAMATVAACSGNGANNPPAGSGEGSGQQTPKGNGDKEQTGDKKHAISGITYIFGNPSPSNGAGLQQINERFNVDYKVEKIPQENFVEKLTAVVSGGSMPDMVGFRPGDLTLFQKWAKQGAFLPLNDYIDQYETFKMVPQEIWDQFTVDGQIYGMPSWAPTAGNSFLIRKDWLDNLNLSIPTSYEELKQVAIAFTKDDPNQNGQDDTYGMAMGMNINPDFSMGPYWQNTWYHKDEEGNFIPGLISEGRKELIQFFHDLNKEKAITPDFAVLNWADTNNEFYSGKAGIFLVAPRGMSQPYMESLLQLNPEAEFAVIPPFESPDGKQGFTAGTGYARFNAFNANLAQDPDKLNRVFEIHDFSRKFYPFEEHGSGNADYDWFYGGEGTAYRMEDGNRVELKPGEGFSPAEYFQDSTNWIPEGVNPEFERAYTEPKLIQVTQELMELNMEMEAFYPPHYGIISETEGQRGTELNQFLLNEQTKMIVGQRPISDWEAMVSEYLNKGGAKVIEEMNAGIKERGYTELNWK